MLSVIINILVNVLDCRIKTSKYHANNVAQ